MYYNVKLQLVELLQTLKEMVKEIGREQAKYNAFKNDCIAVSKYVHTVVLENEGHDDTSLKRLSEIFYMSFEEYIKNRGSIDMLCRKAKATIMKKLQTRWRMYFLPYNHSMWHAMESIYDAATKDPRCDAYVMPLPYKMLNIDGSVQEERCEMYDFKEYNVVNYADVDIESIRPEFIFIHNAYDEYNNLTRIDERYHSPNLQKCTNNLVYTPYYTFFDAEKNACDKLMIQQGVAKANYVIAQSKAVEREFVKRGLAEKKIIALGSPKIDKVVRMRNNPPDMPKEWEEKLVGRKVILYTFALEICAVKDWIIAVKDCMQSYWGDEDIAIIFRPHPLVRQYAYGRNANTGIVKEIFDIAENADRMVLDEHTDASFAYMHSDALMLSGTSSIMNEYMALGKPIYFDTLNYDKLVKPENLFVDYRTLYFPTCEEVGGIEAMIKAHSAAVCNFFGIVKSESEDTKKQARQQAFAKAFENIDGTAGEKIYNKMIELMGE